MKTSLNYVLSVLALYCNVWSVIDTLKRDNASDFILSLNLLACIILLLHINNLYRKQA